MCHQPNLVSVSTPGFQVSSICRPLDLCALYYLAAVNGLSNHVPWNFDERAAWNEPRPIDHTIQGIFSL